MAQTWQVLHGAIDRIMLMLGVAKGDYVIRAAEHPSFLKGRCAEILLKSSGVAVGVFGTVHPQAPSKFAENKSRMTRVATRRRISPTFQTHHVLTTAFLIWQVLENFELEFPTAAADFDAEAFLRLGAAREKSHAGHRPPLAGLPLLPAKCAK